MDLAFVDHCAHLEIIFTHSLSLASVKSRLVLPFWYQLTQVVPDNGPLNAHVLHTYLRYRDSVDDTVEENSSIFSLIRMRWLPSARACRQLNFAPTPVLNWRCRVMQVDFYMAVKRWLCCAYLFTNQATH